MNAYIYQQNQWIHTDCLWQALSREKQGKSPFVITLVGAGGKTSLIRRLAFEGIYQVNAELMKLAHPGAMVQHCLPAHRGEEITAEVFEAHADEIFEEAENRLHAQKAVMSLLMGGN